MKKPENSVHILNGDALLAQIGDQLEGQKIVFRECLCTGPRGRTLRPEFWEERTAYLRGIDPTLTETQIRENGYGEIHKIAQLAPSQKVYCWFEEDLFCQVHFWTTIAMLEENQAPDSVFWVRPRPGFAYGYSGMSPQQFQQALREAKPLSTENRQQLAELARAFDQEHDERLASVAEGLSADWEPVKKAVQLELSRPAGPLQIMRGLMEQHKQANFGTIFQFFHQKAPEYGFGDLQVKELWDQIRVA